MRGLLSSRRLWAGVVGVVAIAAVATSVIFIRGTSAATPFVAHPISVHPQATLSSPSTTSITRARLVPRPAAMTRSRSRRPMTSSRAG